MELPTFANPVVDRDFADPFVLKHRGVYYAYSTGYAPDGRCFAIMRSRDLVRWEEAGGAMEALPGRPPCMWAPEVWYEDGRFYLYYSAGNEEIMHLRVAVAGRPEGPFVDAGRELTSEPFAIDAHAFLDRDGTRYLFYATDFLEHTHVGTGTVVDRMLDPLTLEGRPRVVARARYDWQVYDPARASKGGVRWHTVEGPFVLERKGRYYEMFSAGNWQHETYGVAYATSDRVLADGEWAQRCDGETCLPILRTLPGAVLGPGHNSVVRGPDNRQLYCVYHYWPPDLRGRVMAIDRLEFVGDRLVVLGPTAGRQPAPLAGRVVASLAEGPGDLAWVPESGAWRAGDDSVAHDAAERRAAARLALPAASFLFEATVRGGAPSGEGRRGVELRGRAGAVARVAFEGAGVTVEGVELLERSAAASVRPAGEGADRPLRIEVDERRVAVRTDGAAAWVGELREPALEIALFADASDAEFAAPTLTFGWEDLFTDAGDALARRGWATREPDRWRAAGGELRHTGEGAASRLVKGAPFDAYEMVVSLALDDRSGEAGLLPALDASDGGEGAGPEVVVTARGGSWRLVCRDAGGETEFALPEGFDPLGYEQLRVVKVGARAAVTCAGEPVAEVAVPARSAAVGVLASGPARFDMVRVTEIPDVAPTGGSFNG